MQNTAIKIVEKLQKKGFQAFFAGGCVRDLILKKDPEDFDIATNAKPEEIEHLFENTYSVGKHFGVILIKENEHLFEIATFRSDSGYSDGRRPDYVTFTDAKEDALRRDFTINGIFYDPVAEEFHDFVDGKSDLKREMLRFIGDPDKRIREDHLRIIRAVRFKNRFHFAYQAETRASVKKHASLILSVSAERIYEELNKIIIHQSRKQAFEDLDRFGILEKILPEVHTLKKVPQDEVYHSEGNAFKHSLSALAHIAPGVNPEACWAVLLHDIGKTQTVKYCDNRIHFYGHQEAGLEIAKKLLKRLKFSGATQKKILWLIQHHHLFDQFHKMKRSTKLHYFDNPYFSDLLEVYHADLLGSIPKNFSKRKKAEEDFYEIKAEFETAHVERALPSHLPELLTGEEIMKILKIPAGPKVGEIKGRLRELQLEKKIMTKEETVKFLQNQQTKFQFNLSHNRIRPKFQGSE